MNDDTIACACGCGRVIPRIDSRGRERRYVVGHHQRASQRPDDATLRRLHIDEQLATKAIGERYGVADTTVRDWLHAAHVPVRNPKQAARIQGEHRTKRPPRPELERLYTCERRTSREIGERYGVSANTVRGWLEALDIPRRPPSQVRQLVCGRERPEPGELHRLYVEQEMSATDIARALKVHVGSVLNWLRAARIPIRSLSETQRVYRKKRGLPDGRRKRTMSPRTRYSVLERDGFRCRACGRSPQHHGVVLHVDHVVPRSKGGSDEMANLQALCAECNQGKADR